MKTPRSCATLAATLAVVAAATMPAGTQNSDGGIAAVNAGSLTQPVRQPAPRPENRPGQGPLVRKVADKFKGTHDLAGAAEALVAAAGSQFAYDYGDNSDPTRKDFASAATVDQLYGQRLMICYEFVHYVGYLASNQLTSQGGAPRFSAASSAVYNNRDYEVWDEDSEIPRGKVVVFVARAFNNDAGYYHVGISLGGGKIAHNSSSGNVQISDVSDVNSIGYSEVRVSDYNFRDALPTPDPPEEGTGTEGGTGTAVDGQPIGQLPELRQALDTAEQGLRYTGTSTCCGDPLGTLYAMPAAAPTRRFQIFITGEPVDERLETVPPRSGAARVPGLLDLLARYRPGVTRGPRLVRAALQMRSSGTAPFGPGSAPTVAIVATGASTGDAFRLQVIGGSGPGRLLAPDGLVLEPLGVAAPLPRESAAGTTVRNLPGFCAEFSKDPPPPGTMYRVADSRLQQRFKEMRQLLRTTDDLAAASRLHPDSDPREYYDFVKQWAVWTRAERWSARQFGERFIERTKKNLAEMKEPWTSALEREVRALVPGRWGDIQAVIGAAAAGATAARSRP